MAFDQKRFLKAKMEARTEDVPVPDLAAFFSDGEPAVWTVRGLTGQELGRANEAAAKNKLVVATMDAIATLSAKEQIEEIKNALGLGSNVPDDVARRIEYLTVGSVNPAITQEVAVKLCETYPVEFYELTNIIAIKLTGKGSVEAKKKPIISGETEKSEPVLPSVMPEDASCLK